LEVLEQIYIYINQFLSISMVDFEELKLLLIEKNFTKKEVVVKAGDVAEYLYFISAGTLREFFIKNHQEVTTDIITEGTISGSVSSFFTGKPSKYIIEAVEPVQTFAISKENLNKLYANDVKWERFGRVLTAHFLIKQEQHILDGLRYNVRERFEHFFANHHTLLQRLPQKYLASYLQIKPETFSRLKKAMYQESKKKILK
jgi:CRP-like cAMP-binding protein